MLNKCTTIIDKPCVQDYNKIIGKDRVVFGEDDSNLGVVRPKDGLEMIGIVSNETKTKLGNDFYDFFYSAYSKLKLNLSSKLP